jgi:hypothetical protein
MFNVKFWGLLPLWWTTCCCCSWCVSPVGTGPEQMYQTTMNLSLPREVDDFSGAGAVYNFPLPTFMSNGYFEYEAQANYFELLQHHQDFPVLSDLNRPFREVSCEQVKHGLSGTFYTDYEDEDIDFENKTCFAGVIVPYQHHLVYNPNTGQVQHFFNGMRD